MAVTVGQLFAEVSDSLSLRWVDGHGGHFRGFREELREPADMVGYLNLIHPNRLHVIGSNEVAYYERLDPERRRAFFLELLRGNPPAVVMAEALAPPRELRHCMGMSDSMQGSPVESASRAPDAMPGLSADSTPGTEEEALPLWISPLPAARVIERLRQHLGKSMAEFTTVHGVLMDVLGLGVLLQGESGLGKSELGLELISRGHGLVADDVVELTRVSPVLVEGKCPPLLQNMLEVRGLGLLDIRTIFGEAAVRRKIRLRLIVHLMRRSTMEQEYERLPLQAIHQEILGIPMPKVIIPVAEGRNLAVLTEAAVRSTILKLRGIDSMKAFFERQRELMDQDPVRSPGKQAAQTLLDTAQNLQQTSAQIPGQGSASAFGPLSGDTG